MIAIVDYGVGNIFSLVSSFSRIGADIRLTGDPEEIRSAEKVILPGVGAFRDAAEKLKDTGLGNVVKEQAAAGKPLLGICLGMQMLFDRSFEYGEYEGLGLIRRKGTWSTSSIRITGRTVTILLSQPPTTAQNSLLPLPKETCTASSSIRRSPVRWVFAS